MKNLSLNFYNEEIYIQCPKDFASLKKEIALKYQLTLSDVSEIDISYIKDETKKVIKTEIDFKTFLHSRIPKLNLVIKESSTLYQKSILDLQKKKKDDLAQLEVLKKKKEENKRMQAQINEETKNKIEYLNNEIKEISQRKLDYVKSIKKMMRGPRNKEKELMVKITKLGNEIGAPLVFSVSGKEPLPVKGETEKEKKYLELIKRNTDCINVQEKLYATPRKNMADMDKQLKEINKKSLAIIKSSQKEIISLKKEENKLIKEIIDLEKKCGLFIDEKKPMKKTGFYFPNRDTLQIKTIKKDEKKEEKENSKKSKEKLEIKLPDSGLNPNKKYNKKIENVLGNLKKNIKQDIEKHISKTNEEIKKLKEKAKENKYKLEEKDKIYLEKCEEENDKAVKEVDKWIEFILKHSHEIIEAVEMQNNENSKKIEEIEKKIGFGVKKNNVNDGKKEIVHPGVVCKGCKGDIIGVRYKCTICEDFDFCEKCEEKNQGRHGHPLLKINRPDMCPVAIKCILNNK